LDDEFIRKYGFLDINQDCVRKHLFKTTFGNKIKTKSFGFFKRIIYLCNQRKNKHRKTRIRNSDIEKDAGILLFLLSAKRLFDNNNLKRIRLWLYVTRRLR
jgi:hypothetical protein